MGITLLGGALLVLGGFVVGLLVGASRDEPQVALRHLTGETEVVPAPSEQSEASVSVATLDREQSPGSQAPTAPPLGSGSALTAPPASLARSPDAALAAAPETPAAVSAAPPSPAAVFSIQVGAFAESHQADRLAERLRKQGLRVYVSPGPDRPESRWRVRVGPLESHEEAKRLAKRLQSQEKLPTWILDEGR